MNEAMKSFKIYYIIVLKANFYIISSFWMKGQPVKTSRQSYITDKFLSKLVHNLLTYEHLKKHIVFAIFSNLFVLEELKNMPKS